MLKIRIYIFISEPVHVLLLLYKRQSSNGASPELCVLIYTCVGMCTALSMHTCGCVCACKCVSVYFSKAHFWPCVPLYCISLSLCHLLVSLSV